MRLWFALTFVALSASGTAAEQDELVHLRVLKSCLTDSTDVLFKAGVPLAVTVEQVFEHICYSERLEAHTIEKTCDDRYAACANSSQRLDRGIQEIIAERYLLLLRENHGVQ